MLSWLPEQLVFRKKPLAHGVHTWQAPEESVKNPNTQVARDPELDGSWTAYLATSAEDESSNSCCVLASYQESMDGVRAAPLAKVMLR
jgi:hypothetical protein